MRTQPGAPTPLSVVLTRTRAAGSRSASDTAGPRQPRASGCPPGPCLIAECSAADLAERGLRVSAVARSLTPTAPSQTSIRHARRSRANSSRQHQVSSSDSSPKYCFVAFRLGMIVLRKTVCSSSTNGTSTRSPRAQRRRCAGQRNGPGSDVPECRSIGRQRPTRSGPRRGRGCVIIASSATNDSDV
jgi:hypothetical protein